MSLSVDSMNMMRDPSGDAGTGISWRSSTKAINTQAMQAAKRVAVITCYKLSHFSSPVRVR